MSYEPMREDDEPDDVESRSLLSQDRSKDRLTPAFSRLEYAIFLVMGVAMLWAWYVLVIVSSSMKWDLSE